MTTKAALQARDKIQFNAMYAVREVAEGEKSRNMFEAPRAVTRCLPLRLLTSRNHARWLFLASAGPESQSRARSMRAWKITALHGRGPALQENQRTSRKSRRPDI